MKPQLLRNRNAERDWQLQAVSIPSTDKIKLQYSAISSRFFHIQLQTHKHAGTMPRPMDQYGNQALCSTNMKFSRGLKIVPRAGARRQWCLAQGETQTWKNELMKVSKITATDPSKTHPSNAEIIQGHNSTNFTSGAPYHTASHKDWRRNLYYAIFQYKHETWTPLVPTY